MPKDRSRWKQKLVAFIASTLLVAGAFGLAEIFCRYFLDINLRKTSREFVVTDPNGFITANRQNAQGVSFGVDVFSDAEGFRIPKGYNRKNTPESEILLVGDSVTFGVGVTEEQTFAGLLRSNLPNVEVYNSGVIGFSLPDYVRTVNEIVDRKPGVDSVYLFYTLNDFQTAEAYAPREAVGLWGNVKRSISSLMIWANDYFGARSKLYVAVTGAAIDPSRQYYMGDVRNMSVDDERFDVVMSQLSGIADEMRQRNIAFTVVLNPYEFQLRNGSGADLQPQERVRRFLGSKGINVLDPSPRFASELPDSRSGFLFADPMHLSAQGHRLIFETVMEDLANRKVL